MKNMKRLIALMLCLAMIFGCILSMASCKKNKDNDDTPGETETPGDQPGDEPGDQPGDEPGDQPGDEPGNNPADKPDPNDPNHTHTYESKVTRFPTPGTTGLRTYTCACGHFYTEDIAAVTVTLPSVADALASIIGQHQYGVELKGDTNLMYISEIKQNGTTTEEINFVAVKVAHASVSGEGDTLTARLVIDIGIATLNYSKDITDYEDIQNIQTFNAVQSINLYVQGDAVSLEITTPDGTNSVDANLSELFYGAMSDYLGVDYNAILEAVYLMGTMQEYLPLVEGIFGLVDSVPTANTSVLDILALVGAGLVEVTEEGNLLVYSLDIASIAELLEELKGMTVAEIIDSQYGAGSVNAIASFIKTVPGTTVKQIVDRVITFSEESGVPIDSVYALINYAIYSSTGVNFDIESVISGYYNMTVADVITQMSGEDMTEIWAQFPTFVDQAVAMLGACDIDQLFNLAVGYDEGFSIINKLQGVAYMLGENVQAEIAIDTLDETVERVRFFVLDAFDLYVGGDGCRAEIHTAYGVFVFTVQSEGNVTDISFVQDNYDFVTVTLVENNGYIVEAYATVKYVEIVHETVLDSTGTNYVTVTNEVLRTALTFNYKDNGDGTAAGQLLVDTDEGSLTVNISKNSTDASTLYSVKAVAVVYGETALDLTLDCCIDVLGITLDVTAESYGETIVTSIYENASGAGYTVYHNDNVLYRIAVENYGDGSLKSFDYIIGGYAYSGEEYYNKEDYTWNVITSEVEYYEVINFTVTRDAYGAVYASCVINTLEYDYQVTETDGGKGEIIAYTTKVVKYFAAEAFYNGTDTIVVSSNGYEIVFKKVLNDCGTTYSADFVYAGVNYHAELYISPDLVQLGISTSDNSISAGLKVFIENGIPCLDKIELDVFGGKYQVKHEIVDGNDRYTFNGVVDGLPLDVTLDVLADGAKLTIASDDDVINITARMISNGEYMLEIYAADSTRVYMDANLVIGTHTDLSTGADQLIIQLDLEKLLLTSGSNSANGEVVRVTENFIRGFFQLVLFCK